VLSVSALEFDGAVSGRTRDTGSGSQVNWLVSASSGLGSATTHRLWALRSDRRRATPRTTWLRFRRKAAPSGLDPALELLMEPFDRIGGARARFHWLSGSPVNVKSRSPASSTLSAWKQGGNHRRRPPPPNSRYSGEAEFKTGPPTSPGDLDPAAPGGAGGTARRRELPDRTWPGDRLPNRPGLLAYSERMT
jgi:hypothetical protein